MKPKVLITETIHECIVDILNEMGYDVDYKPKITREEILETLHDYTGVIVRSKTNIDKEYIDAGNNLKFVARSGAGMDQVDIQYAVSKGIALLNAPEGNRDAVAEHTVGMLLNLTNKLNSGDHEVRDMTWDREGNRGIEVMGRTFGIIGFGNMGEAVSKRLAGFGCTIIAYDKYKSGFGNENVEEVSLEELFKRANIVSFHIPLTDETKFYVDDTFINSFEKNIILLNTARGEIVKLKTLVEHLKTGKIIGAGLDVIENEKLKTLTDDQHDNMNALFEMKNVIFTPHVAGWTIESYIKISETIGEKIKQLNLV